MYVRDEHSRTRNEVHLIFRSNFGHSNYSAEVKFTSFFFGGFITAIAVNPLERKLATVTSNTTTRQMQNKKNREDQNNLQIPICWKGRWKQRQRRSER